MNLPVSNARSQVEPSSFYLDAESCDSSRMSCVGFRDASTPAATQPAITLEPVLIEGDGGARRLVEEYERGRGRGTADCETETMAVAHACGKAAATAVGGAGSFLGGPITAAGGVAATFLEGVDCGKALAAAYWCRNP